MAISTPPDFPPKAETMNPIFEVVRSLLDRIEKEQMPAIHQAAHILATVIKNDGIIHVFGTGHSHMMALELFDRAGGLAPVNAILDSGLMLHESALTSTLLERLEGYASIVLKRYSLKPEDCMIVISNSGRNPAPIEAAMEAKRLGLPVIALTSLQQSRTLASRHSSGKHLCDLADVVLDNLGIPGDAALSVEGLPFRICPTSTIIGASILESVVFYTVQELLQDGIEPPLLTSANLDNTLDPEHVFSKYRHRIRHL